ncbi:uncharacterized protein [Pocillopora verrucosa]|uniref:uncharacterized protein isoform X1 n=1 Tax=Pocillopora verrucosa TaxID=203993 RepID=UPI003341D2D1
MQIKLLLITCFLFGACTASYLAEKREDAPLDEDTAQEVEDLNEEDFETASDKFDGENDEEPENENEAFDELRDEENERDAEELEEMNDEDEETDEVSEDPRPVPRKSSKKYGYLYGKGKGYRKYRKGLYQKKPRKSYSKGYRKYRFRKGYYPKKGKGYGYRYAYRYPYYSRGH